MGLRYTDWVEDTTVNTDDILTCPAAGPTLDDCSCTSDFTILSAIAAGCIPKDIPQSDTCCNEYMKVVQEHQVRLPLRV